jgi:two-component system sensor histidine kinase CreC
MSLTARILLGFLALSLAGWFFVLRPVADRVERQYLEAAEEPMVDAAEILAALVGAEMDAGRDPVAALRAAFDRASARTLDARIYSLHKEKVSLDAYLTDASGVVRFDSAHPERVGQNLSNALDVFLTLHDQYGARSTRDDEYDSASSVMYVAAPVRAGGRIAGVLSVYKPQRSMYAFIHETREELRRIAVVSMAGFLIAGLILSRWVADPLRRLTEHANAVTRGERTPAPKLPGQHLKVLANALETMRDALEGRRYVERYVNHLTHEMKSPLSAIRGAAELLEEDPPPDTRRKFLANIAGEAARLQRLIEQLLALASLETRKRLETRTALDLADVAREVCAEAGPRADSGQVTLALDASAAPATGDPILLARAAENLIQNAIEFSPAGTTIRVRTVVEGGRATLTVEDEGPGIPDFALPNLFTHFYSLPRPGTGRKSSGLGLCLAREAALLHGGTVTVENRAGTKGAIARMELPAGWSQDGRA